MDVNTYAKWPIGVNCLYKCTCIHACILFQVGIPLAGDLYLLLTSPIGAGARIDVSSLKLDVDLVGENKQIVGHIITPVMIPNTPLITDMGWVWKYIFYL